MQDGEKFAESSSYQPSPNVDMENWSTQLARNSWEYTCTFCFKNFRSAQALGGHQNAHRAERKEERRLYVKDPILHRRRLYLQSRCPPGPTGPPGVAVLPSPQLGGECPTLHGSQHNSNSLPLDLNLPPTEFNDVVEGGTYSTNSYYEEEIISAAAIDKVSNKRNDDNEMVNYETLDLNLKL